MAMVRQLLTEGIVPEKHGLAEPHDQQERPAGTVAESVVLDTDSVGFNVGQIGPR